MGRRSVKFKGEGKGTVQRMSVGDGRREWAGAVRCEVGGRRWEGRLACCYPSLGLTNGRSSQLDVINMLKTTETNRSPVSVYLCGDLPFFSSDV